MEKLFKLKFQKERARISRHYAKVGIIFSFLILPLFYLKDIVMTEYPVDTLKWRLFPLFFNVIYIILNLTGIRKRNGFANTSYLLLMVSYLIMILGITYDNIGLENNLYNSQLITSMIVVFAIFFLFSGGIKRFLSLLLIPYAGFIFLLVFVKKIDTYTLSQFFNPSVFLLLFIILAYINYKYEFASFRMRIKLEISEKKLRSEVSRRILLEEQLKLDALTDELTGCYNRKAAEKLLKREQKICQREKADFAICYFDINNLKIVNDQLGHKEGDTLICNFASIVSDSLRETDYVFRIGGDEFICFLKCCSRDFAVLKIREIRGNCSEKGISFSAGIADSRNNENLPLEKLISLADKEMYQEKRMKKKPATVSRLQ